MKTPNDLYCNIHDVLKIRSISGRDAINLIIKLIARHMVESGKIGGLVPTEEEIAYAVEMLEKHTADVGNVEGHIEIHSDMEAAIRFYGIAPPMLKNGHCVGHKSHMRG